MARTIELSGITVVGAGAFNPAIFHPWWFVDKDLMARNAIDEALEKDFVALRELASFTADWLSVQVTTDQLVLSTVEEGREFDLRDLAKAVFELLPDCLGSVIRFLDMAEVESLVSAASDDEVGRMERVLYITAAMTGLRQGELIALRWKDVDWPAGVIRVRRSRTRGKLGTPKSRRSVRAVPMNDRLAGELERHYQRSAFQADDALVFAHPQTGRPYDPSKMRSRFKQALKRAGIARPVRFHDLRHTYGTHMAGAGVPMRVLQEFMGHRSVQTTEVYADYSPRSQERQWAEQAFAGNKAGNEVSASEHASDLQKRLENEESLPEGTA